MKGISKYAIDYFKFFLVILLLTFISSCTGIVSTTYTITATSSAGGTIQPAGVISINEGGNQIFTITIDEGYQISDVLVDGISVGPVSTYSFTNVSQNHTISASYVGQGNGLTYTITATAGAGGNIDPTGEIILNAGESQTFTITPFTGFLINEIVVDGLSIGSDATYTFENVSDNHTIDASFVSGWTWGTYIPPDIWDILVQLNKKIYNDDTMVGYDTIQEAIDAAQTGETIIVSPGTYYENINFDNKNITVKSVNPSNASIVTDTIIDGNKAGQVVEFDNDSSTLQGFTIQNGGANQGAGIIVYNNSSPAIKDNNITANKAAWYGGGIHVSDYSDPDIINNNINGNEAIKGGGIYVINHSDPTISGNTIESNIASESGSSSGSGGGIYICEHCDPVISDNTIKENEASSGGGGIGLYIDCSPVISGNMIKNNGNRENLWYGGGITMNSNCSPSITDNTITHNKAIFGGGISVGSICSPTIEDNIISGNQSSSGGGIQVYEGNNTVINRNTISGNQASGNGGGINVSYKSSSTTVTGNTIEDNDANFGGGIYVTYDADLMPSIARPAGWGSSGDSDYRQNIPIPPYYTSSSVAGNTFSGNSHNPLSKEGADVYFHPTSWFG